jgi:hypothetical protein
MLPSEPRLPEARPLIETGQYFVVHAPRQTGKTTTLSALSRRLTAEGESVALLFSCERAEVAGDDYGAAELLVLRAMRDAAELYGLPGKALPPDPWPEAPPGSRLFAGLREWAARCPLPLTLVFDEIDALRGEGLRSVLRQLRDGFPARPGRFPSSVVLCGLRDVRDYKVASGSDPERLGTASPFHVKVTSLRIGDFSAQDLAELYGQHTGETGQEFTSGAVERAFACTQGQPWLANALAREVTTVMKIPLSTPITAEHMDQAKERLILSRATHLDSLAARLSEKRVQRVIEPLLAGQFPDVDPTFNDDLAYVRDLGLVAPDLPVRVANPIYREVIARVLGDYTNARILAEPHTFLLPDGRLDFPLLLTEFTAFWREHGDILVRAGIYHEAAAQLVMMAFVHRVVNGGGYIDREYGIGTGRIDLLIRKPYTTADGVRAIQREAIELKVWRRGESDPLAEGLQQLDRYLDRLNLPTGTLAIFDRRPSAAPIHERTVITDAVTPAGRQITLLRA